MKLINTALMICMMGLLGASPSFGASAISIASVPLAGMGSSYGPNVLFGLSIEYPTAKSAFTTYPSTISPAYISSTTDSQYQYQGYFDPSKCYTYSSSGKYFVYKGSSSGASTSGIAYTCSNAWSGNFLNWVTMTAIDIFRAKLTGGNRALGTTGTSTDYSNGDTSSFTTLRRAAVVTGQNQNTTSAYLINKMLSVSGGTGSLTPFSSSTYPYLWFNNGPDTTSPKSTSSTNIAGGALTTPSSDSNYWSVSVYGTTSSSTTFTASNMTYLGTFNVAVQVCASSSTLEDGTYTPYSCSQYGSYYKPEGLMQQYGGQIRFGAASYLTDLLTSPGGGVLRARLKYPGISSSVTGSSGSSYTVGKEWNSDGTFVLNPDTTDAKSHTDPNSETVAAVSNSGVINYINKFGDGTGSSGTAGYKKYDPAGELYYAALRYYRNMGSYASYTKGIGSNSAWQGGFPVITDWDDPVLNACQKNFIVYIGDTNTNYDYNLPGSTYTSNGSVTPSKPSDDSSLDVATWTNKLGTAEGFTNYAGYVVSGAVQSPPYIAGMAFWANTNNVRTNSGDTMTAQVKTFMLDVVEKGDYKASSCAAASTNTSGSSVSSSKVCNPFYLAAKYGGFTDSTTDTSTSSTGYNASGTYPNVSSEWINSSSTSSSSSSYISAFSSGYPAYYAPANSPSAMTTALTNALSTASSSNAASQAALAGSSTSTDVVSSGSYVYQSAFDSTDWSGDLIANTLSLTTNSSTGAVSVTYTPAWHAKKTLETQLTNYGVSSRNVLTYDLTTLAGATFNDTWFTNLSSSSTQKTALNSTDSKGSYRVSYLRGDKTQESSTASPQFRSRNYRLGDIVHSTPVAIPTPTGDPSGCAFDANLSGTTQSTDRTSIFSRPAAVAVASNDGFLHIFNTSGTELAAFLPASSYTYLANLTSTSYTGSAHQYFNDGSPIYANTCFTVGSSGTTLANSEARSVVVGTTGAGGTGVYALDVTHPDSLTSSNVLWEFSSSDDTAMGYSIGTPRIVKLHNGRPAVIFGNGYNQTGNSGKGSLIIAYLDKPSGTAWTKGTNYFRIDLPALTTAVASPNGLSSPATVDIDGDGVVDYVYAGDLNGNMWKFDLTSSTPSSWGLAYGTSPLFTACSASGCAASTLQPITSAPVVTRDPLKGYLVLFGTGQYLSGNDLSQSTTQTLYGIRDAGAAVGNTFTATMLAQSINSTSTTSSSSTTYYNSSSTSSTTSLSSTYNGWYLPMTTSALSNARVVTKPTLYKNTLVMFTAVIPNSSTSNACTTGSTALISLGYATGNAKTTAVYDTSGDGVVSTSDSAASVQISSGINPGANYLLQLSSDGTTYSCTVGSGGAVSCTAVASYSTTKGRLSWREIIQSW